MKVYLTGASGFLGGHTKRRLLFEGHEVYDRRVDLTELSDVVEVVRGMDAIVHCAGVVGGMLDNRARQADFLADNVLMGMNVFKAAVLSGVGRVVVAGSSCMYPDGRVGSPEIAWEGRPYEGNAGYGIAKRVVAEASELFKRQYGLTSTVAVFPNLYGPGADDSQKGHFVASVARKLIKAKADGAPSVLMMGDGTARRELLYVEDAAKALNLALVGGLGEGVVNVGWDHDCSIEGVVGIIKEIVGYEGGLVWGSPSDNGQMRKLMNSGRAFSLGWSPETTLADGIRKTVEAMKA